MASLKINLKTI
jgi:hypothetical protein